MMNARQDVPASFTIWTEEDETQDRKIPGPNINVIWLCLAITGAVIAVVAAGLILAIGGLMHADSVNAGQAAQIRALNQANARMSGQLSQMNPASDTKLVTCGDLRKMGLTVTTGGTVSSVPGSVSLAQNPIRIPAHCPKR